MNFRAGVAPNPPGLGDFLLVMADAYLCSMPMTFEMLGTDNLNSTIHKSGYEVDPNLSFGTVSVGFDVAKYSHIDVSMQCTECVITNQSSTDPSITVYKFINYNGKDITLGSKVTQYHSYDDRTQSYDLGGVDTSSASISTTRLTCGLYISASKQDLHILISCNVIINVVATR